MRRLIGISILAAAMLLITGCTAIRLPGTYNHWIEEKIESGEYTSTLENYETDGLKWALEYCQMKYEPLQVQEASTVDYISSASFSEFSDECEIHPAKYICRVVTKKASNNSIKMDDGNFLTNETVYVVSVLSSSKLYLCGFLDGENVSDYEAGKEAYKGASSDKRFSGKFKPYPDTEKLPSGLNRILLNNLIEKNQLLRNTVVLPDGKIALLTLSKDENTAEETVNLSQISFVDAFTGKLTGIPITVSPSRFAYVQVESGRTLIEVKQDDKYVEYVLDEGKLTPYQTQAPVESRFVGYSPDGSHIAYSKNGNLYVASADGKNETLLLQGNDSQDTDRKYYYAYEWTDNDTILYEIGGYEWSAGCGLVTVSTGKQTPLSVAGPNAGVFAVAGGKVFTTAFDMGAPFHPGYIDLSDNSHTWKPIFTDEAFLKKIEYASYAVSPDGSTVAIMLDSMDPYKENELLLCDISTGAVKNTLSFVSGFCRPQYINYAQTGSIILTSEPYAFSPEYAYVYTPKK